MPPVMMTTVIPIAMIPIGAKLRVTLAAFSVVPKLGSLIAMTTTSTMSAIVTQNGWLEIIARSKGLFLGLHHI